MFYSKIFFIAFAQLILASCKVETFNLGNGKNTNEFILKKLNDQFESVISENENDPKKESVETAKSICKMMVGNELKEIGNSILNNTQQHPQIVRVAAQICAKVNTKERRENFGQNAEAIIATFGGKGTILQELRSLQNLVIGQLHSWEEERKAESQPNNGAQNSLLQQFHGILEEFAKSLPKESARNAVERVLKKVDKVPNLSTLIDLLINRDLQQLIEPQNTADNVQHEMFQSRIKKRSSSNYADAINYLAYFCGMIVLICYLIAPADMPNSILAITLACILWLLFLDLQAHRQ